jgi:hypothetical protein
MLLLLAGLTLQGTDTTVAVRPGARLNLDNFEGDVVVTTWSRSVIRVQATHDDDTRMLPAARWAYAGGAATGRPRWSTG